MCACVKRILDDNPIKIRCMHALPDGRPVRRKNAKGTEQLQQVQNPPCLTDSDFSWAGLAGSGTRRVIFSRLVLPL